MTLSNHRTALIWLIGAALATAATTGLAARGSTAAGGGKELYVSPTGQDGSSCAKTRPCQTLRRAYSLAGPGATILMLAGTYPQQQIRAQGNTAGPPVLIHPAPNAVVRIQGLQLGEPSSGNGPRGLVLRDLLLPDYELEIFEGARDITVQDVRAANFYIRGAQRVRILGGSYGPCLTDGRNGHCGNSKVDTVDAPYTTDNIVIDHVTFHDYRIVQGSGAHFECLFIRGGSHVVVTGSRFVNCEFFDLFIQWSGTPIDGLRIEGNRFEPAFNGSGQRWEISLMFSGGGYVWPRVRVLRNSFVRTWPIMDDGTNGGFADVIVGENLLGVEADCFRGVTYRGNVGSARSCGPSDRAAVFGYRLVEGRLVPQAGEAATVRKMFAAAASGRSTAEIARGSWATSPPAGHRWSPAAVRSLLTDRVYLGSVVGPSGAGPALVRGVTWRAAQRTLSRSPPS